MGQEGMKICHNLYQCQVGWNMYLSSPVWSRSQRLLSDILFQMRRQEDMFSSIFMVILCHC